MFIVYLVIMVTFIACIFTMEYVVAYVAYYITLHHQTDETAVCIFFLLK